ncbi:MAG: DUF488 domain-containing protein [Dehalococcoidia bacterium]
MSIEIKRAYEPPAHGDGYRVLIDRLWPRGVRKDAARIDVWAKELAPSTELREWFGHDPEKWGEFRQRYARELRTAAARALLDDLARRSQRGAVTLVYAAKDTEHSNATALRQIIGRRRALASPRGIAG